MNLIFQNNGADGASGEAEEGEAGQVPGGAPVGALWFNREMGPKIQRFISAVFSP